jgi:hypothetical protein
MTFIATICVVALFLSNIYILFYYLINEGDFEDFMWVFASLILFGCGIFLGFSQLYKLWKNRKN